MNILDAMDANVAGQARIGKWQERFEAEWVRPMVEWRLRLELQQMAMRRLGQQLGPRMAMRGGRNGERQEG